MTKKQHAAVLRMIKQYTTANTTSASAAKSALIKEGIYTKTGRIAKKYGGEAKTRAK